MRVLVDTNVFLDFFLNRGEQGKTARTFFLSAHEKKDDIYVSAMSFRDIEYITRKIVGEKESHRILHHLYEGIKKIVDISPDDVINAIFEERKDFEDSLLIEAAERAMVDAVITNNLRDFKNSQLPIFSPEEYLSYRK